MADENGCHKHILVALSRPRPFQKVGEKTTWKRGCHAHNVFLRSYWSLPNALVYNLRGAIRES